MCDDGSRSRLSAIAPVIEKTGSTTYSRFILASGDRRASANARELATESHSGPNRSASHVSTRLAAARSYDGVTRLPPARAAPSAAALAAATSCSYSATLGNLARSSAISARCVGDGMCSLRIATPLPSLSPMRSLSAAIAFSSSSQDDSSPI